MAKSDLKFFLTGALPSSSQTDVSQSIGGYPSTTEVNPSSLLSSSIGFGLSSVSISSACSGDFISIGSELIRFSGSGTTLTMVERGSNSTDELFHAAGTVTYCIKKANLFNASFDTSGKQYRCIAVTNTSSTDTFYNLKFYVKKQSITAASVVKMSVELPSTELFESSCTKGSSISLTDSSLAGSFVDNHFVGCNVYIDDPASSNYGASNVAASYDGRTGTFTFLNAFPFSITSGTLYRVNNAPSQRVDSGVISPAFGLPRVSALSAAVGESNAVSINVSGNRVNGSNLAPHETVYLWFERSAISGVPSAVDNRIIFTASYTTN